MSEQAAQAALDDAPHSVHLVDASPHRPRQGRHARVGVQPLLASIVPVLPLLALWGVLLVGRAVCLVAQRVPPVVWVVRAVRERLGSVARAPDRAP